MAADYSVETCRTLEKKFISAGLHRPMRTGRYDTGTELVYDVTAVGQSNTAKVCLVVEKFIGGGYAGQVYRVKLTSIESGNGLIEGLEVGGVYAIKILIPPSSFSRLFRNVLYWIGFQGRFQLQVNPTAAMAGALWQKFIRRGAKIRFGDEESIVDIHGMFVDKVLGGCGELREWVEGRTWRLEVDDRMDYLKRWRRGNKIDPEQVGSPEYRAKREFMAEFVKLLHDMGAHEFARQYEWSTCKSQPNCLKRQGTEDNPAAGLTAVDFRAGLTLLPFLPMSPGDFKLIAKGVMRGSLVQFDRGNIKKLERFMEAHSDEFADMREMLQELKCAEQVYRNSVPDITHNHIRLLYSGTLWSTMLDSAVTGWETRNIVDDNWGQKLRNCKISTLLFFIIGLIPFLGKFVRRIWARPDWRKHYRSILTSWGYFQRAIKAKTIEKVIVWHRAGRVDVKRAEKISGSVLRLLCHQPFSILPAGLHRFLTDREFRKNKLAYIFVRPFKLYFNAKLRRQWLDDMVTESQRKHILSDEDASAILSQLKEPYIQKYLISLVVHLLTLPVTQIVSVTVVTVYILMHPELSWEAACVRAGWILIAFQVVPISPGSLVRGFYVLYLVKRERDFKDYNIATFLSFFKYIGYLAFPIQMAYHYPALARFMASHWATEAAHIVPVFGERGALLEHWVFCLFYNWPLTIRRRMRKRAEIRATMKPRYWHLAIYAVVGAGIFTIAEFNYLNDVGQLPKLRDIWWLTILVSLLCGAWVTLGAGGTVLWKRIVAAAICGVGVGVLYTAGSGVLSYSSQTDGGAIAISCVWRVFIFAILSTIGAIITELKLPEPNLE
ncbi:MAG: hypothetical protein ACYS1A_06960 [Planctomycetota bacterium]|jgi:hypothetical protein